MLELKTSDRDDGRSLPTLSPLDWDHRVLRRKEENTFSIHLVFNLYYVTVRHNINSTWLII